MKKILLSIVLLSVLLLTACGNSAMGEKSTSKDTLKKNASQKNDEIIEENGQKIFKVSYDDTINKQMFSGFSKDQLQFLNDNNFLIVNSTDKAFIHSTYKDAKINSYPVFITTDSVLNMYHIFYSESLKALEESYLYSKLAEATLSLLESSKIDYEKSNDNLKPYYEKLYSYYYTSARLLFDSINPLDVKFKDSKSISDKKNTINNLLNRYHAMSASVPENIKNISNKEYEKIINGYQVQHAKSDIFSYDIDYSQFIPRGHYNSSEILKSYFRCMMNYSLVGFELKEDKSNFKNGYITGLLMAKSVLSNKKAKENLDYISSITSLYAGKSDDINIDKSTELLNQIYGDKAASFISGASQNLILDESYYEKAMSTIMELPLPRLMPKTPNGDVNTTNARKIKMLGQRFNFDSYVLRELIKPGQRENISSFDVLATFKNKTAENILEGYYNPSKNWDEYYEKLEEMQNLYEREKETSLNNDLYHIWLTSIDKALNERPKGYVPHFMTTSEYGYKRINTALGSYAELKHDNILYSKQMLALGGTNDKSLKTPLHYVEPNIELYHDILRLLQKTKDILLEKNIKEDDIIAPLDEMIEMTRVFVTVSEKELEDDVLTESELKALNSFGDLVEYLNSVMHYLSISNSSGKTHHYSSALVSDIAKVTSRGNLELGIGKPLDIYVLTKVNGTPIIAKGSIYSACEFFSSTRLSNKKWLEYNGIYVDDKTGKSTYQEEKDQFDIFELMPYTKEFISQEENDIRSNYELDINWPY